MIVTLATISAGMFSKKAAYASAVWHFNIHEPRSSDLIQLCWKAWRHTHQQRHVVRNETEKRTKKNESWWTKSPLSNQSVSLLKGWHQHTGVQMLIGSALQLMIAVSQSAQSPQRFRASLAQQADTKEVRSGNKENGVLKSKRRLTLASVDGKCLMMPWAHY